MSTDREKFPPLRLAAATLREQSFDVDPRVPIGIAGPLADWLDSTANSWERAAQTNANALSYLSSDPQNGPSRVAHAIVALFHGEQVAP